MFPDFVGDLRRVFHRRSRPMMHMQPCVGSACDIAARVPRSVDSPHPARSLRIERGAGPSDRGTQGSKAPDELPSSLKVPASRAYSHVVVFGSEANLSPPQGVDQRLPSSLGGGGAGQLSLSPLCDLRSRVG